MSTAVETPVEAHAPTHRRTLSGKLIPLEPTVEDRPSHNGWHSLVPKAEPTPRTERTGEHYERMVAVSTPSREFVEGTATDAPNRATRRARLRSRPGVFLMLHGGHSVSSLSAMRPGHGVRA